MSLDTSLSRHVQIDSCPDRPMSRQTRVQGHISYVHRHESIQACLDRLVSRDLYRMSLDIYSDSASICEMPRRQRTGEYAIQTHHTGWQRPIACLELHVIFRKRAIDYRALLREMTYKDKACYGSTPPCRGHAMQTHAARPHQLCVFPYRQIDFRKSFYSSFSTNI